MLLVYNLISGGQTPKRKQGYCGTRQLGNQVVDLVAPPDRTIVEMEEVYQLIQQLTDTDGGYFHWAAQSLGANIKVPTK